jgi:hypothetical protein
MSDEHDADDAKRDWRGRFVKGVSGNLAGRPRGIVSEATRIATLLLSERAPELVNAAIDRALAGADLPLKLCLDKIIPAPKDQPVAFVMPALADADDLPGAVAAVWEAVAEGELTPAQAATLSQALEAQSRALEALERIAARHNAADIPAAWHRMQLRVCLAIADAVREISEEVGEADERVAKLSAPMLRLGHMAAGLLAAIPDRADLASSDRGLFATHPQPPDRPLHPLAAEMAILLRKLIGYLESHMAQLEQDVDKRAAVREAAGEPDPIYRSSVLRLSASIFNFDAKIT